MHFKFSTSVEHDKFIIVLLYLTDFNFSFFFVEVEFNLLLYVDFPFSIIQQGLDDRVVPPSMTEFIGRVLPEAVIHKLPNEGHFSYFFFCDECHRQMFSTLFGAPQGPVEQQDDTALEESKEDVLQVTVSNME